MALTHLYLRDFVIVQELSLDLQSGFTALTGETGAGKSILIDALQLVLGARADSALVREGADRTEVSAEFDCPPELIDWLERAGITSSEAGAPVLLRRAVDTQGKSRAWINGSPATATQLREAADYLVDIHGQHAWQKLIRPEAVRNLLDAYAGIDSNLLVNCWGHWRQTQQQLLAAQQAQHQLQDNRDRLLWQISELDKLAPAPGQWEELQAQHSRLSHAQTLLDAAQNTSDLLESEFHGVLKALAKAHALLHAQVQLEPDFLEPTELLESAVAQLQDANHCLHSYLRKTEPDPQALAQLDERLGLWISLARRYKRNPQDLAALHQGWKSELASLDAATDLAALQAAHDAASAAYMTQARRIASLRAQAAPELSRAITEAMQGLGMPGGKFEVGLQNLEQPCANGLEDVIFLVAGHAGSTPRPVAKVASGGELSRIALAIAVTTSELGSAQTLVFDEVDSGVGGTVAETVGQLMRQLGRTRQVLAVTHLPQVAACADHHLVVSKQRSGASVRSDVLVVQGDDRVNEVARMLGGGQLQSTSQAHARHMLKQTQTEAPRRSRTSR